MVQVTVIGNDVAQSLKVLKKKMQREGIFREMKLRRHHEKNSEKKARRQAEAVRRARKQLRKRLDTEGFGGFFILEFSILFCLFQIPACILLFPMGR